jgi:DNA repair exonuclease SbcCD ATPase subunit
MTFQELRDETSRLRGQRESLRTTVERLDGQLGTMETEQSLLGESRELLGKAAARSREEIKGRIERMVTHALQTILERDDYRFEIRFEDKRGRIEVEPILHTSVSSGNPLDNNGGGVVDIISTTLRLIVKLMLGVPGPLILDEPAKWIAEAHRPHFMKMLREFSEKTETQIIFCTHITEYIADADRILDVRLINGESVVNEIISSRPNEPIQPH